MNLVVSICASETKDKSSFLVMEFNTFLEIIRASIFAPTTITRRTRRRWLRAQLQKVDRSTPLKHDQIDPEQLVIVLHNGKLYRAEMQSSFEVLLIDVQLQVTLKEEMQFFTAPKALEVAPCLVETIQRKRDRKYTSLEKQLLHDLSKVCKDKFLVDRRVISGEDQLDTLYVKIPELGFNTKDRQNVIK